MRCGIRQSFMHTIRRFRCIERGNHFLNRRRPSRQHTMRNLSVRRQLFQLDDIVLVLFQHFIHAHQLGHRHHFAFEHAAFVLEDLTAALRHYLLLRQVDIVEIGGILVRQNRIEHVGHFFRHKRQRPREHVHEVRQVVRMWRRHKLSDIEQLVVELQARAFVLVHIAIVWGTENGNHARYLRLLIDHLHFVAVELRLMRTDNRRQIVLLEERGHRINAEHIRALAGLVVRKPRRRLSVHRLGIVVVVIGIHLLLIVDGVGP
mmetsp:Transcript_31464/g.50957  ORF Transcript_31464/g.50957 Transcript_31464/m.50957 type:complete len:261 (-) Transcript_31464:785-1567(-)